MDVEPGSTIQEFVGQGFDPRFFKEIDFQRGRIKPRTVLNFSTGVDLFRKETAVEDVMKQMDLKRGTIQGYLEEYIRAERPGSISAWVPNALYQRIAAAFCNSGP